MLEKDIERKLVSGVHRLGGAAYKWTAPGQSGVPDRIVFLPGGRIVFVELKTENGRLTMNQILQQKRLNDLGCQVVTLYGMEQVECFLEQAREVVKKGGDAV